MRANFSIRRPTGLLGRTPGELLIGGVAVARSRSFDDLLDALAGHLAALAVNARPVEEPRVRAFSNGRRVVLTDLLRPALVDDQALAKHGVRELHLWSPDFADGPAIALPPPLERVVGVRHAPLPATMEIGGVVLSSASADLDHDYGWLPALRRLGMDHTPESVADEDAARNAILNYVTGR